MDELNKLKESIIIDNQNLQTQKENYLSNFINLNLENDILTQINENLINYYKSNLSNFNLSTEEIASINKSFNYFTSINSLGIDISNLYIEDQNLINLKNNIKLLYTKLLEYKNIIISSFDSKINSNNHVLENINKLKEIINSNNIDLEEVHDLINLLPVKDKIKISIYKYVYNKYLSQLKSNKKDLERDASELLERIILETEPSPEIEEKIEEQGIKLEITEADRALHESIQELLFNIRKLNNKFPTEEDMKNKTKEELDLITEDKVKYSKVSIDINNLITEFENYLQSKDNNWSKEEYLKEELDEYFNDLLIEFENKFKKYNQIYYELYNKYGNTYKEISKEDKNDVVDDINSNYETPIIFFSNGIDRFIDGNNENIPNDLEESLIKNKKFISKIKKDLEYLKQRDFSKLSTDLIDDVKNKFREIKVVNRTKNDLAIRIYYKFSSDSNGNSYPVVFMIYAKPKSKPQEIYEHISKVIGSNYFNDFMKSLPEQSKLNKVLELEKLVYDKIEELENQKLQNKEMSGGSSK